MPVGQPDASGLESPVAGLARLDRYLSLPLVFAVLGAATFAVAWNRGIALVYALFAVLVGAVFASAAGARWMLRAASVRIALPGEASVGDWIYATASVIPRARPHKRHLLQLRSPYPFAPEQHLFLSVCGLGAQRSQRVQCARRGLFRLSEVVVVCAYPFGLLNMKETWAVEPAVITVYPRTYPVSRFDLPSASHRTSGELERPAPSVGQELFRETRDYRSGDNPRHIHWRSSARHGRLIVKQFDAIATSETWIVLDLNPENHAGLGEHHSFERAVEIAASVAAHLIRLGLRCGIAGGLREDGPVLMLPPAAGDAHLQSVMDALAGVQASCPAAYPSVLAALAPRYRRGQQWILFQHGEARVATPEFLRNQRALWFRFDTRSFSDTDSSERRLRAPGKLADGFAISRDTDLAALFR